MELISHQMADVVSVLELKYEPGGRTHNPIQSTKQCVRKTRQQAIAIIQSGKYESPNDGVCRLNRQGLPDRSNLPQLVEARVDQSCNMVRESEGRVNDEGLLPQHWQFLSSIAILPETSSLYSV